MKKFEFRLDRVKKWRADQSSVEESKLRSLHDQRLQLEKGRESLAQEKAASEKSVLGAVSTGSSELVALDAFRRHVAYQDQQLVKRIIECNLKIEAQRQNLLEARRKFRLLEKLKERSFTEWQTEFDREQQNVADEIYLSVRGSRR